MSDQPLPEGTGLAILVEKLMKERDLLTKQLAALRWQIENEGCAASHLGETTYECRADAPCGLCRLRSERDALRAVCEALIQAYDNGVRAPYGVVQAARATVNELYQPTITYSGPSPTTVGMVRCIKCHALTRSNVQCVACGTRNVTTLIKEST